ncbi:MAG TPA: helix-turn-helix domain-containing protein [Anaerolineae bacterium]|nr:helix-turn-helix domain-containing protein [Anaerolineae bacterium]
MPKKNQVHLRSDQRNTLLGIIKTGQRSAREILYAYVLLKSAQGWTDAQIAAAFDVSRDTVRRIRLRFSRSGLKAALHERPRPGAPRTVTPEQETALIALACSKPPEGYQRWTVRRLAEEAVKRHLVPGLAAETLRQLLKKTPSSPGNSKAGAGVTSRPNSWPA